MFALDSSAMCAPKIPDKVPFGSGRSAPARQVIRTTTPAGQSSSCRIRQNARPLFSYSYKLLSPQFPYFDIHTNCRGMTPKTHPPLALPHSQSANQLPSLQSLARSFVHFLAKSENQLLCFHARAHSFVEMGGTPKIRYASWTVNNLDDVRCARLNVCAKPMP